jgi:hypothetical protein
VGATHPIGQQSWAVGRGGWQLPCAQKSSPPGAPKGAAIVVPVLLLGFYVTIMVLAWLAGER